MSDYISSQEVHNIVKEQLGSKLGQDYKFHTPDGKYFCPSVGYVKKLIQHSSVDKNQ